jgi:hypothetical protein
VIIVALKTASVGGACHRSHKPASGTTPVVEVNVYRRFGEPDHSQNPDASRTHRWPRFQGPRQVDFEASPSDRALIVGKLGPRHLPEAVLPGTRSPALASSLCQAGIRPQRIQAASA